MEWSPILLIELVLVFGSVLAWGGWELWTLRRDRLRDARQRRTEQQSRQAQDAGKQPPASAP